jgi:cytoskeletal protein CcmA (bactofilin family)
MWKPNQPAAPPPSTPDPRAGAAPGGAGAGFDPRAAAAGLPGDQATIGKSLVVKGEISGSESLYIDGKVEGSINLPGNRVTVGRNGQVAATIMAREIVVLGKIRGNCQASDRVDIRAEGSLTGDVIAARISIEDGAFFKGGIDIRKQGTEAKPGPTAVSVPAATPEPVAAEG